MGLALIIPASASQDLILRGIGAWVWVICAQSLDESDFPVAVFAKWRVPRALLRLPSLLTNLRRGKLSAPAAMSPVDWLEMALEDSGSRLLACSPPVCNFHPNFPVPAPAPRPFPQYM
jgi:hypothetical protein